MIDMTTRYFDGEGRPYMNECIQCALRWSVERKIRSIVMFTSTGDGPHYAATNLLPQEEYKNLRLIAVTPPVGKTYYADPRDPTKSAIVAAGIPAARKDELLALGVQIIAGQLPFKEMHDGAGNMRSEWTRVTAAMGVLGGGFALCIQAALMACDAGEIEPGTLACALSADTAITLWASRSDVFLSPTDGMIVDHIICRPANYPISRAKHRRFAHLTAASRPSALPPHEEPPPVEAPLCNSGDFRSDQGRA